MDSVDRQALLDADLDPDDPQVWAVQQRISDLRVCYGLTRATRRNREPRLAPEVGTPDGHRLSR
jgi:hypothetical protein